MVREGVETRYTILLRWLFYGGRFPFYVGVRMSSVNIKSFTPKIIEFEIFDHTYEASPDIPLGLLQQLKNFRTLGAAMQSDDDTPDLEPLLRIFDELLLEDDAVYLRGSATGAHGKRKQVGIRIIMDLIPWLLEQYGLRPTQPSSHSSNGLNGGEIGTSSTDGAVLVESQS